MPTPFLITDLSISNTTPIGLTNDPKLLTKNSRDAFISDFAVSLLVVTIGTLVIFHLKGVINLGSAFPLSSIGVEGAYALIATGGTIMALDLFGLLIKQTQHINTLHQLREQEYDGFEIQRSQTQYLITQLEGEIQAHETLEMRFVNYLEKQRQEVVLECEEVKKELLSITTEYNESMMVTQSAENNGELVRLENENEKLKEAIETYKSHLLFLNNHLDRYSGTIAFLENKMNELQEKNHDYSLRTTNLKKQIETREGLVESKVAEVINIGTMLNSKHNDEIKQLTIKIKSLEEVNAGLNTIINNLQNVIKTHSTNKDDATEVIELTDLIRKLTEDVSQLDEKQLKIQDYLDNFKPFEYLVDDLKTPSPIKRWNSQNSQLSTSTPSTPIFNPNQTPPFTSNQTPPHTPINTMHVGENPQEKSFSPVFCPTFKKKSRTPIPLQWKKQDN